MIRLLRHCHVPLMMLLSFSAPITLMLCPLAPGDCASLALIPALLIPMIALLSSLPGRVRAAALVACFSLLAGAGYVFLPRHPAMAILPVCCCIILFYSLSYADRNPAELPPMLYFACILSQLAALFVAHFGDVPPHIAAAAQGVFCLWLALILLACNRISLNNATLSRYRLSAGMAHTGTVLTLCVLLLSLLLCAMPAVVASIRWIFGVLRDAGIQFMLFLVNLFPEPDPVGGGIGSMPLLPIGALQENTQPSLFSVILERIAAALSMVILVVGSVILARLLIRLLVRLIRVLFAHLQRHSAAVTEDYEDEISDTRQEDGERSIHPLRRRARPKTVYPDTPAGRIRRRYAQLLARHSAWQPSSTARENLPAGAAALYERARYSDHALSAEDAQRFEQET